MPQLGLTINPTEYCVCKPIELQSNLFCYIGYVLFCKSKCKLISNEIGLAFSVSRSGHMFLQGYLTSSHGGRDTYEILGLTKSQFRSNYLP